MKNRIGMKNRQKQKATVYMSEVFSRYGAKLDLTTIVQRIVEIITVAPLGTSFWILSSLPWLLRNLPSLKVTLEKYFTIKGTMSTVRKSPIVAEPTLIPRANIRFQKLSLFNLDGAKGAVGLFGRSYIPPYSFGTLGVARACDAVKVGVAFGGCCLRLAQKLVKSVRSSSILSSYSKLVQINNYIVAKIYNNTKKIILATLVISWGGWLNYASAVPSKSLQEIFAGAENQYRIPKGLLVSIAHVESSIRPHALNINGKAVNARTGAEARQLIQAALRAGTVNIDIGIMQLNHRWHRSGFSSEAEMLDIEKNISYAACFLAKLKKQHGDWHTALRHYHSANPEHYRKYSKKVVMCWIGN